MSQVMTVPPGTQNPTEQQSTMNGQVHKQAADILTNCSSERPRRSFSPSSGSCASTLIPRRTQLHSLQILAIGGYFTYESAPHENVTRTVQLLIGPFCHSFGHEDGVYPPSFVFCYRGFPSLVCASSPAPSFFEMDCYIAFGPAPCQ